MPKLNVPHKHIQTGLEAVKRKHNNEGYVDLVVATYKSYEKGGNPDAPLVPYVQFVLDATLASLESHNSVVSRLNEVRDRAYVAATYATSIDRFAFEYNRNNPFFVGIYDEYPVLREMMLDNPDIGQAFMTNREYMSSLVRSPFSDVSLATGGVIRFLKNQHALDKKRARSIALASEQLAIIGSIPKALAGRALQTLTLGSPYIDASHLKLEKDIVVFNSKTKDYILHALGKQVPNSGCSAGRISYRGRTNVMREGWANIASYLLTQNPTADATVR